MNGPLLFETLLLCLSHSEFLSIAQLSFGCAKDLLFQFHSLPFTVPRMLHPTYSYSLCVTDVFDKRQLDPCKRGQFHEAICLLFSASCCVSLCLCLCVSPLSVSLSLCLSLCPANAANLSPVASFTSFFQATSSKCPIYLIPCVSTTIILQPHLFTLPPPANTLDVAAQGARAKWLACRTASKGSGCL